MFNQYKDPEKKKLVNTNQERGEDLNDNDNSKKKDKEDKQNDSDIENYNLEDDGRPGKRGTAGETGSAVDLEEMFML